MARQMTDPASEHDQHDQHEVDPGRPMPPPPPPTYGDPTADVAAPTERDGGKRNVEWPGGPTAGDAGPTPASVGAGVPAVTTPTSEVDDSGVPAPASDVDDRGVVQPAGYPAPEVAARPVLGDTATAVPADVEDQPAADRGWPEPDADEAPAVAPGDAAEVSDEGADHVAREARQGLGVSLLSTDQIDDLERRWLDIKLRFVDDPGGAASRAEELAGEVLSALTAALQARKADVDHWDRDTDSVDETLSAVRGYRDLLDQLLGIGTG